MEGPFFRAPRDPRGGVKEEVFPDLKVVLDFFFVGCRALVGWAPYLFYLWWVTLQLLPSK
jgi:hypothetical protein